VRRLAGGVVERNAQRVRAPAPRRALLLTYLGTPVAVLLGVLLAFVFALAIALPLLAGLFVTFLVVLIALNASSIVITIRSVRRSGLRPAVSALVLLGVAGFITVQSLFLLPFALAMMNSDESSPQAEEGRELQVVLDALSAARFAEPNRDQLDVVFIRESLSEFSGRITPVLKKFPNQQTSYGLGESNLVKVHQDAAFSIFAWGRC
jgi:hypothetical protein